MKCRRTKWVPCYLGCSRQRFHQLKDGTLVKLSGANLSTLDRLASDLDLSEQQLNSGLIELPGGLEHSY